MISDVVRFGNDMKFLGENVSCEYMENNFLEKCDIYLFCFKCNNFLYATEEDYIMIRLTLNEHLKNWYCYDVKKHENKIWFYFSYKKNKTLYVLKECSKDISYIAKKIK